MLRIIRSIAFFAALSLVVASCNGSQGVTGNPSNVTEFRTLASMLPYITKSLTPALTEERFGLPNQAQGSGVIIFVYNVEDGKKVSLGFPGYAPISFAKLQDRNGTTLQDLPILD
jgi:hypothetical protein